MRIVRSHSLSAAALLLLALTAAVGSRAQESPALTPTELLASSLQHYPMIIRSLAMRRVAQGRATETEGAFDVVFSAEGLGWVDGFYDGQSINGRVKKRIRPFGASVYAGYDLSNGDFPIYEDRRFTNTGGTAKLGMLFSLLRGRDIDKERFDLEDARLRLEEAELDLLLTKIGVQQRALVAYWRWVAIGRQLEVYRDLLRIAQERQAGFEEQIRRGARARIFLTENSQNITRRQILVKQAERDLGLAANRLSLYYRDAEGRPKVPRPTQLPASGSVEDIYAGAPDSGTALSSAVAQRPELALLRAAIEREQYRIALRENDLMPELDLGLEMKSGLGAVAEGGASRDSTDTVVAFSFSVPLQQRKERGKLRQSRAKLDASLAEEQTRREEIELEVRNLLLDLRAAQELLALAELEAQQSALMRNAELNRFESGASDFFLVNIREETAADAQIKLFDSRLRTRITRTNYDAATVNLDRLGISELTN